MMISAPTWKSELSYLHILIIDHVTFICFYYLHWNVVLCISSLLDRCFLVSSIALLYHVLLSESSEHRTICRSWQEIELVWFIRLSTNGTQPVWCLGCLSLHSIQSPQNQDALNYNLCCGLFSTERMCEEWNGYYNFHHLYLDTMTVAVLTRLLLTF